VKPAAKAKPAAAKPAAGKAKATAADAAPVARGKAAAAARKAPAPATKAAGAGPQAPAAPGPAPSRRIAPKPATPAPPPRAAKAPSKTAAPAAKAKKAPAKPAAKAPAAPRPARGKARQKLAPDRLALLVDAAMKSLEDDKAENIVLLDVTGRADYADRLIIATGLVERQLTAMATHLDEALAKAGLQLRRDNIQASGDWVLIDAGDLVIHLFRPEARELYRLERMWGPESPGAADAAPV
jgi:ribosome silencing factor RsfS/YbeB/iojap